MKTIVEERRLKAPTITPQALAWDGRALWLSSRDLGTLQKIDVERWLATEELDPPGIVWAAVATNGAMHLTIGKGLNDDRYVYRYDSKNGFKKVFACPDFTGSYLSYDTGHLYLSQWYEKRILKYDDKGNTKTWRLFHSRPVRSLMTVTSSGRTIARLMRLLHSLCRNNPLRTCG